MESKITLYNRDRQNNIIEWSIKWDFNANWYTTSSGRYQGVITETKPTYCFGKNIGRSNETTDIEQCQLEVQSKIEKQRKRGFQEFIPERKQFEVTLAKEFKARKKFIKFPMLVSAKLDGFRCYVTKDGMFSRTHHEILSCPHIFEQLKPLFDINPNLVLDGELYSHELKDNFNKVASLLSRTKNLTPEFLAETKSIIKYHIFDSFTRREQHRPYQLRNGICVLKNANRGWLMPEGEYIMWVYQKEVKSFEEVEALLDKAIEAGFEGIMLRDPDMGYEEGRTSNLVKYKRFHDAEYKIVDILPGVGNHADLAAVIVCQDNNGEQFSAGLGKGWDEARKRELLENKSGYIGRLGTICYQELTPDKNVPRFGKLLRIRSKIVP